ncbi:MAG TPA: nuclear transport factor 2 family protein [Thermoanaerobaculia bacterium]|jgi:ketosteroid isomerase-like protein
MKNLMSLLGIASMLAVTAAALARGVKGNDPKDLAGKGKMAKPEASTERNIKAILEIFRAIEQRDPDHPRELELIRPDVEFHWPPALPYGGTFRGRDREGPTWSSTWNPLQPTEADRKMDPRVVGASGNEVVVLYRQRGVSPNGERFDGEVIGLYRFRDGKLSRGQMFYFDEAVLVRFLARAGDQAALPNRTP